MIIMLFTLILPSMMDLIFLLSPSYFQLVFFNFFLPLLAYSLSSPPLPSSSSSSPPLSYPLPFLPFLFLCCSASPYPPILLLLFIPACLLPLPLILPFPSPHFWNLYIYLPPPVSFSLECVFSPVSLSLPKSPVQYPCIMHDYY